MCVRVLRANPLCLRRTRSARSLEARHGIHSAWHAYCLLAGREESGARADAGSVISVISRTWSGTESSIERQPPTELSSQKVQDGFPAISNKIEIISITI